MIWYLLYLISHQYQQTNSIKRRSITVQNNLPKNVVETKDINYLPKWLYIMELGLKVRPTTTVDRPNLGLMVSLLLKLIKEKCHRNNTYEESKRCKKDRLTGVPSFIYRVCMVIEKENKLLLLLLSLSGGLR